MQQDRNHGPSCHSAGALKPLRVFRDNPPVADVQVLAYINLIVVLLPPGQAQNAKAVEAIATWLQQRMEPLCVALNQSKFHMPFPPDTIVEQCTG